LELMGFWFFPPANWAKRGRPNE